jgi:hypothetical protein
MTGGGGGRAQWTGFSNRITWHGRHVCHSQRPARSPRAGCEPGSVRSTGRERANIPRARSGPAGRRAEWSETAPEYHKNTGATARFTSVQYRVTQQDGTERPFGNEYWDNKDPGIYVDVVTGEPLFASVDTYHTHPG